jgi:KDO2-lipid IV(A) lauroyltransferase
MPIFFCIVSLTSMLAYISYCCIRILIFIVGLIPLDALYRLSKGVSFLLQYLLRYRKRIIDKNLKNAFPTYTEDDRKKIKIGFYRYFADLLLESFHCFSMSFRALAARVRQSNPEVIEEVLEHNSKIVIVMGHYGNFEWLCRAVMSVMPGFEHICLYQPVSNKYLDNYIKFNRGRYGMKMVSVKDMKGLLHLTKNNHKQCIWFVMDQVPGAPHESAHWMQFLHQDTPVIYGPEKFAKRIDAAVVYVELQQKERGTYELASNAIVYHACDTGAFDITEKQIQLLEKGIEKQPTLWLWSHNRWKHQRKHAPVS